MAYPSYSSVTEYGSAHVALSPKKISSWPSILSVFYSFEFFVAEIYGNRRLPKGGVSACFTGPMMRRAALCIARCFEDRAKWSGLDVQFASIAQLAQSLFCVTPVLSSASLKAS